MKCAHNYIFPARFKAGTEPMVTCSKCGDRQPSTKVLANYARKMARRARELKKAGYIVG